MSGRIPRFIIAAVSAVLLAVTAISPALAETGGSYTATVRYYDSVAITYNLYYPSGGVWMGAGDIPLGGAGMAGQIYCADPFVAFHSMASSSWEDTTTDRMDGYVVAAPWAVSGAMKQNGDAVRWLVLNGYRGEYNYRGDDDAESKESVARLQGLYPNIGAIDKTIAVMATKVAVWKVLAGDNFEIVGTSLNADREAAFFALAEAMAADAVNGRATGLAMTGLALTLEEDYGGITEDGGYTYVPLSITARLENSPAGIGALDGVYLTVSGPDSGGITFVSGIGDDGLPVGMIYGTDQEAAYLPGAAFTGGGGVWTGGVYMRVPAGREPDYGDQLTVRAMAMMKDVMLQAGTPVTLVYEGGGIQDWNRVQAFIGAAKEGMSMNLYAEDSLYTGDTRLSGLYVQKLLESPAPTDDGVEFTFAVYSSDDPYFSDFRAGTRLNLTAHPVSGASGADLADNTFTLKNGGIAFIDGLRADRYYWVEEIDTLLEYVVRMYSVSASATGLSSRTEAFRIDDTPTVVFTNTKVRPFIPETPETPEEPETPRTPEPPETPETPETPRTPETPETPVVPRTDIPGTPPPGTPVTPDAHLRVGKVAYAVNAGVDPTRLADVKSETFTFTVEYSDNGTWKPVNLAGRFSSQNELSDRTAGEWGGGALINGGADGRFYLYHYGMAYLELDPSLQYRVVEDAGPNYSSAYGLSENNAPIMSYIPAAYWKEENKGVSVATEAFTLKPGTHYKLIYTNVDVPSHNITISKTVTGSGGDDRLFEFELYITGGALAGAELPESVRLTTDPSEYWAFYVEGENGLALDAGRVDGSVLKLRDGESATVKNLPIGYYMIRELPADGYAAEYGIDGGVLKKSAETEAFLLAADMKVAFVNSAGTFEIPETPETPEIPETPEKPDGGRSPQTGDGRNPFADVMLLLLGAGIIAAAEWYRRSSASLNS